MTHTDKDLKNKKQEDNIINYLFIGACIIVSLFQIYRILFIPIQPTKMDFGLLLYFIWTAVITYLVDIKQVTEKSEKRALWKIVIKYTRIIVIIALVLSILEFILH